MFSLDSPQPWHWPSGKLPKQERWSKMGTRHLFAGTLKNLPIFTLVELELERKALEEGEEMVRIIKTKVSLSFSGLQCMSFLLSHRESERI